MNSPNQNRENQVLENSRLRDDLKKMTTFQWKVYFLTLSGVGMFAGLLAAFSMVKDQI